MMDDRERTIGEKIANALGWTIKDDNFMGSTWYEPEQDMKVDRTCRWNPLGDWGCLGYLVEYITWYYSDVIITTSLTGEIWKCHITDSDASYTKEAETLREAICLAILEMFAVSKWETDGF